MQARARRREPPAAAVRHQPATESSVQSPRRARLGARAASPASAVRLPRAAASPDLRVKNQFAAMAATAATMLRATSRGGGDDDENARRRFWRESPRRRRRVRAEARGRRAEEGRPPTARPRAPPRMPRLRAFPPRALRDGLLGGQRGAAEARVAGWRRALRRLLPDRRAVHRQPLRRDVRHRHPGRRHAPARRPRGDRHRRRAAAVVGRPPRPRPRKQRAGGCHLEGARRQQRRRERVPGHGPGNPGDRDGGGGKELRARAGAVIARR